MAVIPLRAAVITQPHTDDNAIEVREIWSRATPSAHPTIILFSGTFTEDRLMQIREHIRKTLSATHDQVSVATYVTPNYLYGMKITTGRSDFDEVIIELEEYLSSRVAHD